MGRARVKRKVRLMSDGGHGPAVLFSSYGYSLSLDRNPFECDFGELYLKTGVASRHALYYTEKPAFPTHLSSWVCIPLQGATPLAE